MVKKMDLLKIKKQIRKTRPRFIRSGATHIKRVSRTGYRSPKGLHNKVGDNKRGRRAQIDTGYGYPKAVRGKSRNGLDIVTVRSESELAQCDPAKHSIIVAASVGMKKKLPLLKACVEKKFTVQNITQLETHVTRLEDAQKAQKQSTTEKKTARRQAQAAAIKAVSGKEDKKKAKDKAPAADANNKKAEDKKEQDKVLAGKKQ